LKVLLTGVTGYIGKRLLPILIEDGHQIVCCTRDKGRVDLEAYDKNQVEIIEVNFLDPASLNKIPDDIDAAYYLIHSMSASIEDFSEMERQCALNFRDAINKTKASQVIYLSGIVNDDELSDHLRSRKVVEETLYEGDYQLTTLRAGIIVGSGSSSFEIMRDLVEKLPVMVTPKWLNTKSQPIAIRNVLQFLKGVLGREDCYGHNYDIGGPEVLTYKEMLLRLAKVRKLKRFIYTVPIMTPKLSSYWLYFVTSTSYKLAVNLVDSMKVEVIGNPNNLSKDLGIQQLTYEEAIELAFDRIEQNSVVSSWTDALSVDTIKAGLNHFMKVPSHGCFTDRKKIAVKDESESLSKIWSIGGENGWYFGNWLWEVRGFLDKLLGGVGLRRGRKNQDTITAGEALDFWRVIYASKDNQRLLLYAEMKLPGEAWLEFKIKDKQLVQTATFRPKGVWGRFYWYLLLPFHHLIFNGMANHIAKK
jgi:uncharacterized protein YbjT (DUF2867 family)